MSTVIFTIKKAGVIVFQQKFNEKLDKHSLQKLTENFVEEVNEYYEQYNLNDSVDIELDIS